MFLTNFAEFIYIDPKKITNYIVSSETKWAQASKHPKKTTKKMRVLNQILLWKA